MNIDPLKRLPVIDVTDLYHPHQDEGDNFDILAAYGYSEVDLRAVILDCTEPFRQPVAKNPGRGLWEDPNGPREPGFVPVLQLNYIFNRNVPCGVGPFTRMRNPADTMTDVPGFQHQGIELILRALQESAERVQIMSFGSARTIAAAYNRDPELFKHKVQRICLTLGAAGSDHLNWNVALDQHAIVRLLRSDLPIALFPCSALEIHPLAKPAGVDWSYDSHNSYWKMPELSFIRGMDPRLQRYLDFAFARVQRMDFLRAMDEDLDPALTAERYAKVYHIWETGVWIVATGRKLVRRQDGTHRIVQPVDMQPGDVELINRLDPCSVRVDDDGLYTLHEPSSPANRWIYNRGDPLENERALQEALPALYQSFHP